MKHIDSNAIQQLLDTQSKPAVTIYVPMLKSASPPHISENQIRLKNLIHQACESLEESENGRQLARELNALRDRLHGDMEFWEQPMQGLLICAVPGSIEIFSLPIDTEEYVAVDDSFHLAPVIALASDQREFYLLVLAQHNPILYKGDMYGLTPSRITLPENAETALRIDESNRKSEIQGSARGSSMNTGWFNGRGGARNPLEQDRINFFRIIDKKVTGKIGKSTPLLLTGVDSDIAEFRAISKHQTLLDKTISGNHVETKLDDLFRQAQEIIWQELVIPVHKAVVDEYNQIHGANPDRTAPDKKSILQAAEQGRIDKLLTRMIRQTTDTVQDNLASTLRITFPEPELSKTINKLAAKVYQMSGKVINLLPSEMPDGAPMVARLRY